MMRASHEDIATVVGGIHGRGPRPSEAWERALVERMMRDVRTLPPREASMPLRFAPDALAEPNVFETPRLPSDPPPLWELMPAKSTPPQSRREQRVVAPPRRSSWPFVLVSAIAGATVMGMLLDPAAREGLVRGARAIAAMVHGL